MCEGFVAANAPGIAQQFTGRRCHLLGGNAFDGDIRRRAVKMLGILRAAHGLVFSRGAVAAANGDGGSELITQRLCFTGDALYVKAHLAADATMQVSLTVPIRPHQQPRSPVGYSFDDSAIEKVGDDLYKVSFEKPLSALDTQAPYYIHFHVKNAVLYGFGGDVELL